MKNNFLPEIYPSNVFIEQVKLFWEVRDLFQRAESEWLIYKNEINYLQRSLMMCHTSLQTARDRQLLDVLIAHSQIKFVSRKTHPYIDHIEAA